MSRKKCKHKKTTVDSFSLPKGTEFEPSLHEEAVFLKCLICGKILMVEEY